MTENCNDDLCKALNSNNASEKRTLKVILFINLIQFFVGFSVGIWAESTAGIGIALDNIADACMYGISLYAVNRDPKIKVFAAQLSGYILIIFAIALFIEVIRHFSGSESPLGLAMVAMASVNMVFDFICLKLIQNHKSEDINFKASVIFTNNDFIANAGIILSGVLVMWLDSNIPDLILGLLVGILVIRGGQEILREAKI